jgi:hypothetical protein
MSQNRKRYTKQTETNNNQEGWPNWFRETNQPVERDFLSFMLKKNPRLSEVYFTVQMMQINYMLFRRNYEELIRLQKQFNTPINFQQLAFQTNKGQEIAQDTILEFTRLLHNFLASSNMLIDVTRRWVEQQFKETLFLKTYKDEIIKRFTNNVQAQFLKDLRNFTLHRTLPLAIPELRMQEVDEHHLKSSLGIVLLKDYLLEWDNWSELGRMQIQMAIDGELDIQAIIDQHYYNETKFMQWLFWQVRGIYNTEVDYINSAYESLHKKP